MAYSSKRKKIYVVQRNFSVIAATSKVSNLFFIISKLLTPEELREMISYSNFAARIRKHGFHEFNPTSNHKYLFKVWQDKRP
jgi:hypothetical protein